MDQTACPLCAKPLGEERAEVNGRTVCFSCRDSVLAELAKEADGGETPLWKIGLIGALASTACGIAWALLIVLTKSEIGFAAVGVGWVVGWAVREAAGGRRGPRLQKTAAACSLLGLVLGKYFFVAHMVREMVERQIAAAPAAEAAKMFVPGWLDPRLFLFFLSLLPQLSSIYDALWLFLALNAAWRALAPAKVTLGNGRVPPPAA